MLCWVTPRGESSEGRPIGLSAGLLAGRALWVLVAYLSFVYAMFTMQPDFAAYFWTGQARALGLIASLMAVLLLLSGLMATRQRPSHFRFLILPALLFVATMPVIVRLAARWL